MKRYSILLPVLLLAIGCGEEKKPVKEIIQHKDTTPVIHIEPLVKPLLETVNVPYQELDIDADSGKTFKAVNGYGTVIEIPASAFVDSAGNAVTGKIHIRFREMHTMNEVLAAGVPLNYNAAGMLKRFNSGGLFEIRATQENKNVLLDSGKVIRVNMASFADDNNYHAFYLDETNTRNWDYLKDLDGMLNPEKKKIIRKARSKVKEFQIPFNGEYFAFNYMALLDVYLNDKVVEIKKSKADLTLQGKIKEYGVIWSNIFCYQSVEFNGSKYLASLLLWKKINNEPWPQWAYSATCNITENANGTFQLELTQAKGKGVYKATIKPFMPIKSLLAFSPSYWKNKYNLALRKAIDEEMKKSKIADVFRTLEVHSFGFYNVEMLQEESDYVQVQLEPELDGNVKDTKGLCIYFVSETYRTVLKYPFAEWKNVTLLPDPYAKLLIVLPENKIAIADADQVKKLDFKLLQTKPGSRVFLSFKTALGIPANLQELAELLGIEATPS